MYPRFFTLAALAASASAQTMNLTALLGATSQLSNLTSYVTLFPDLVNSLSSATNITILAPSNDAFAKFLKSSSIDISDTNLIKAVLEYHVLNGTFEASAIKSTPAFVPTLLDDVKFENVTGGQVVEAVMMDNKVMFHSGLLMESTVTTADVKFTGGIVHIIDTVLTLPPNISTTALAANLTSAAGALTDAKLVDAVDSLSDITVFVPDNEAFQAIGSAIPDLSIDQLTSILEYHVINGTVGYSSDLSDGMTLTTLAGEKVTITIQDGNVFVNDAKVVVPDVIVANGVVHVIDNVLNPNNTSAKPSSSATAGTPAFSGASSVSNVPFTSGIPTPTAAIGGGSSASGTGSGSSASSGAKSSSVSGAAAAPMRTGAMAAAALFGGAVAVYNL